MNTKYVYFFNSIVFLTKEQIKVSMFYYFTKNLHLTDDEKREMASLLPSDMLNVTKLLLLQIIQNTKRGRHLTEAEVTMAKYGLHKQVGNQ